jgi:hypothetical protein
MHTKTCIAQNNMQARILALVPAKQIVLRTSATFYDDVVFLLLIYLS